MEYKIYTLAPGESCPSGWEGGIVLPDGKLLATAPDGTGWPNDAPTEGTSTLDVVKEYKKSLVWGRAAQEIEKMVSGYHSASMSMWKLKLEEAGDADAAGSDAAADTAAPTLKTEAVARGIGTKALATIIKTNSDAFKDAEAEIMGNAGKHCDAIDAKTTNSEVLDYDISTGWPV